MAVLKYNLCSDVFSQQVSRAYNFSLMLYLKINLYNNIILRIAKMTSNFYVVIIIILSFIKKIIKAPE